MNKPMILCVEDDIQVQATNKTLLETMGYAVGQAMTIAEARDAVNRVMPALIVLDIQLPDGNGLDFLRELRKTSAVPVLALTNNKEEQDIVEGLESGCDDYMPKPYNFSVLCARVDALLRRAAKVPETIVKGSLTLNPQAGRAYLNGEDLCLSQKEFLLLLLFAQYEDKVLSAEYIYEQVWKAPLGFDKGALKKQVAALRKRLNDENCGYTVENRYGEGYCFEKV